jgi:hypothetical protein
VIDELAPLHKDPFDRMLIAQACCEGVRWGFPPQSPVEVLTQWQHRCSLEVLPNTWGLHARAGPGHPGTRPLGPSGGPTGERPVPLGSALGLPPLVPQGGTNLAPSRTRPLGRRPLESAEGASPHGHPWGYWPRLQACPGSGCSACSPLDEHSASSGGAQGLPTTWGHAHLGLHAPAPPWGAETPQGP